MNPRSCIVRLLAVVSALSSSIALAQEDDDIAVAAPDAVSAADETLATILTVLAQGLAVPDVVPRTDQSLQTLRDVLESPQTSSRLLMDVASDRVFELGYQFQLQ